MTKPKPSVVVFVADVPKMTTFYRELAAMTLLHQEESHSVLEIEGLQLVVHALRGEPVVPSHPPVRVDTYVKLCLPVDSIAAAREIAALHGGALRGPDAEWEARGFRACDGHDPEGNVIQVREGANGS